MAADWKGFSVVSLTQKPNMSQIELILRNSRYTFVLLATNMAIRDEKTQQ